MDVQAVPVPIESIPVLVLAVVSAVAALISALVPANRMPPVLRKLLDLLASNWGHAANVPPAAPPAAGAPTTKGAGQ